jgi:hypothetical protein
MVSENIHNTTYLVTTVHLSQQFTFLYSVTRPGTFSHRDKVRDTKIISESAVISFFLRKASLLKIYSYMRKYFIQRGYEVIIGPIANINQRGVKVIFQTNRYKFTRLHLF